MPNWCTCELTVEGPEAEVARLVSAAKGCKPRYLVRGRPGEPRPAEVFSFHALFPVPGEVLGQGYDAAGRDWEYENWGVKWGACRPRVKGRSEGSVCYRFDTMWGPPLDFVGEVAADWAGLTITLKYETEEDRVRGTARWEDGSMCSHDEEEINENGDDEVDDDDAMEGQTATPYPYDPECMYAYVQRGEPYIHLADHRDPLLEQIEVYDGDGHDPEPFPRNQLERVAPVLLDLCRRVPAGVLPPELDAGLRKAVEYAGRTEHVENILAATLAWWSAGPGR